MSPGVTPSPPGVSRPDPLLAALLTAGIVAGTAYTVGVGSRSAQVIVCWLLMALLHGVLIRSAWRVVRLAAAPATRRLWSAFVAAGACFLAGDLSQAPLIARDPLAADAAFGGAPQMLTVVAGCGTLLVIMLTLPIGPGAPGERSRFFFDAATVMAATVTFGAVGTEVGTRAVPPELDRTDMPAWEQVLHGPTLFLVGVFAVVKLMLSPRPPFTRAAGALCGTAATVQGLLQVVPASWGERFPAGLLGAGLLANVLLAAAARVQYLQVRADPHLRRPPRRPYSVLPYLAVGATYALLVTVLATRGLNRYTWVVIGGAIACTGLVIARQLTAFRHVAELLAERDRLAATLAHQAYHDSLTGLANRALFLDRLGRALGTGCADGPAAVLLVDLDDFKPVNDRYGHATGDRLLVQVGAALSDAVRDGDTVARLGGDEFAVLVEGLPVNAREAMLARITEATRQRLVAGGTELTVRASVGVAYGAPGTHTPDTLLHDADLAMYAAKARGKGMLVVFGEEPVADPPPLLPA